MNDKPKKGDCGTCHWFERWPDDSGNGYCMVKPPTPVMVMQQIPGSALSPKGPQLTPGVQGMVAPTNEVRRCGEWWPSGKLPDAAQERH